MPQMLAARPGTLPMEIRFLLRSEHKHGWADLCGLKITSCLREIYSAENFSSAELITVDARNIGNKFSEEEVKVFLSKKGIGAGNQFIVGHCWSLSNSCGELTDPMDVERFVSLTFKSDDGMKNANDGLQLKGTFSDYLKYCLDLFDGSLLKSSVGRTQLFENYVKHVREYLSSTDLYYSKPIDNALLTGIIYDFCIEYKVYKSDYLANLANMRIFVSEYLPLISEIFSFGWSEAAPDIRLLFEIDPMDLILQVPTMSIIDSTVIINHRLRQLESYVDEDYNSMISSKVEALMVRDNPGVPLPYLWENLYLYYGQYRTAKERVVKRPTLYNIPDLVRSRNPYSKTLEKVDFSGVEGFFDLLQKGLPDLTLRRRFLGSKGMEALSVYKKYGIGFPPITRLTVPKEYSYLHVDFYKFLPNESTNQEERLIINNIMADVSQLCLGRLVSNQNRFKHSHERGRKAQPCVTCIKTRRKSVPTNLQLLARSLRPRGKSTI